MIKEKLIALNLAIISLIACFTPVQAINVDNDMIAFDTIVSEWSDEYSNNIISDEKSDLKEPMSNSALTITIDGQNISYSSDASGENWNYISSDNALYLNNYNGGSIYTSGDLTVYTSGNVSITGESYSLFGKHGLNVGGTLSLFADAGTLQITGGNGGEFGGNAINCNTLWCSVYDDNTTTLRGGNTNNYSKEYTYVGGHGIRSNYAFLYGNGNGNINIYGGNANTSSIYNELGGCGIYSDVVYLRINCYIQGGNAYVKAPGIYFTQNCEFYIVNATVKSGGNNASPIQNPNGLKWYYNIHTTVTPILNGIQIAPKKYQLILDGNGGFSYNGSTATSLVGYYPQSYRLSNFMFEKPNSIQVGWSSIRNLQSSFIPLNTLHTLTTNTTLYAYWTSINNGDILLNGLDGKFNTGNYFEKYTSAVTLPSQLNYNYHQENVLAWSTQVIASSMDLHVYPGKFYLPGEQIQPSNTNSKILYAINPEDGGYVVYHPTQGSIKSGGSIIVQGTQSTGTDLKTYTINEDYLTAPAQYQLAGWSKSANNSDIVYKPNDDISILSETINHLYAVWQPIEHSIVNEQGLTIKSIPADKILNINISQEWFNIKNCDTAIFAIYDNNKLIDISVVKSGQTGLFNLQYSDEKPTHFKVFALDDALNPCSESMSYDLKL